MVKAETFSKMALCFEGATQEPHFEKTSFRINKKIFATLDKETNRVCLKLSLIDQSVFSAFDKNVIYPIPNAWGKMGWTYFELKTVRKDMLQDALNQAYVEVSVKNKKSKIKKAN